MRQWKPLAAVATMAIASLLAFKWLYDDIATHGHARSFSPIPYFCFFGSIALSCLAIRWLWSSLKWAAIPIVLIAEGLCMFALAVRFGLPFP